MSKGYPHHQEPRISASAARLLKETAAYWFIRGCEEELDATDRNKYVRWLKSSPNNIAELLRMAAYVGKLRNVRLVNLTSTSGDQAAPDSDS